MFKSAEGLSCFKPPGIFLISAFSLLTTDGYIGIFLLEILIIIALPLISMLCHRQKLWGFAIGAATTIYIMQHAGNGLVESFGAFFVCAYVAVIASNVRYKFVWGSIFGCGAILMKDPFALSLISASLVFFWHPRDILKNCIPLAAGSIALWIGILLILGCFIPYFTTYLPYTFLVRVDPVSPLNGFFVYRPFVEMWQHSPVLSLLCIVIIIRGLLTSRYAFIPILLGLYIGHWCNFCSS